MTTETPLVRRHRLTPSFTDSAIDVELTEEFAQSDDNDIPPLPTASSSSDATSLNHRIVHIAHLVANDDDILRGLSQNDCAAVSKYLDSIEKLLDPRPELSRAIALNRPSSPTGSATSSTSVSAGIAVLRRKSVSRTDSPQSTTSLQQQQTSRDLSSVLEELSAVNGELRQRYLESRHIHDLFIVKCEGLAQRIIELENEVHELQSDILEDTIELEGLRGTVRGLDSWVNRWQRQRELSLESPSPSKSARRSKSRSYWRRKHKPANNDEDVDDGNDFDTFLDGVLAWMRGWNDVEEGFLIRARRRKLRRERDGQGST